MFSFNRQDIANADLATLDPDVLAELRKAFSGGCCDQGKKRNCEGHHGCDNNHPQKRRRGSPHQEQEDSDDEDESMEPLADVSDSESDDVEFCDHEGATSDPSGDASCTPTTKPGKERDIEFAAFLEDIDLKVEKISRLKSTDYGCSSCKERKATLFCEACINFFCHDCHRSCGVVQNHAVCLFTQDMDFDANHKRDIHFGGTFQRRHQAVEIPTVQTLCKCGNSSQHKSFLFARKDQTTVFLHHDNRLTGGTFDFCQTCCGSFASLWAYGYLLVHRKFAISLRVCEMLRNMQGTSFTDFHKHVSSQNPFSQVGFAMKDLTLAKFCYLQVLKRLRHHVPCFCCVDPITRANEPDLAIVDYTVWVRDSTSSSARDGNCKCILLADEHEFKDEGKILKEACEKGGSSSTPQTELRPSKGSKCKDLLFQRMFAQRYLLVRNSTWK